MFKIDRCHFPAQIVVINTFINTYTKYTNYRTFGELRTRVCEAESKAHRIVQMLRSCFLPFHDYHAMRSVTIVGRIFM